MFLMRSLCFFYQKSMFFIRSLFFQESEAIALYNKGLSLRNQGNTKEAIQTLLDVLNSPFLEEVTLFNLLLR